MLRNKIIVLSFGIIVAISGISAVKTYVKPGTSGLGLNALGGFGGLGLLGLLSGAGISNVTVTNSGSNIGVLINGNGNLTSAQQLLLLSALLNGGSSGGAGGLLGGPGSGLLGGPGGGLFGGSPYPFGGLGYQYGLNVGDYLGITGPAAAAAQAYFNPITAATGAYLPGAAYSPLTASSYGTSPYGASGYSSSYPSAAPAAPYGTSAASPVYGSLFSGSDSTALASLASSPSTYYPGKK